MLSVLTPAVINYSDKIYTDTLKASVRRNTDPAQDIMLFRQSESFSSLSYLKSDALLKTRLSKI